MSCILILQDEMIIGAIFNFEALKSGKSWHDVGIQPELFVSSTYRKYVVPFRQRDQVTNHLSQ